MQVLRVVVARCNGDVAAARDASCLPEWRKAVRAVKRAPAERHQLLRTAVCHCNVAPFQGASPQQGVGMGFRDLQLVCPNAVAAQAAGVVSQLDQQLAGQAAAGCSPGRRHHIPKHAAALGGGERRGCRACGVAAWRCFGPGGCTGTRRCCCYHCWMCISGGGRYCWSWYAARRSRFWSWLFRLAEFWI